MLLVKTFPLCFIFRCAETYLINQSCTTPLDEESHCVSIDKCAPMINFLNSIEKHVAAGIKNGLRKFVCTFEDQPSNTSICCPSGPFSIDKEGIIMGPRPHKNQKYLPKDCGTVNPTAKILNGRNTELFEFPSMAALFYRKDETLVSKCGGSILSEKYILTAASCLHNTNLEFAGVKVGLNSLSSQSNCTIEDPKYCFPIVQYLLPEKIIIHSEYDASSLVNDIALIRVPNINLVPEKIVPICLPITEHLRENFMYGSVSGWENTYNNGTIIPQRLQQLSLTKQAMSICANLYKHLKLSTSSLDRLCLGVVKNEESCPGDNGSPFQVVSYYRDDVKYIQHGIVSLRHANCSREGLPAIYTNVDYYVQWILDNIKP